MNRVVALQALLLVSISTFMPTRSMAIDHVLRLELVVNEVHLKYDLSPIGGDNNHLPGRDLHFAPGEHVRPFARSLDRPLFRAVGFTHYSGNIARLRNSGLTVDALPGETHSGGEAEYMFFPFQKPSDQKFEVIGGRRWLVTTTFEDQSRNIPRSRVFWTTEHGLLLTLNIIIDEEAPKDGRWRRKRFALLDRLVRGVAISAATR